MASQDISVVDVKLFLSGTGINLKAIDLICCAKAPSTYKQYKVYLKQFSIYCHQNDIDPNDPSIEDCVNFLYNLMARGLAYSTVNMARSAFSFDFDFFQGVKIGETKIVRDLLEGKPSDAYVYRHVGC